MLPYRPWLRPRVHAKVRQTQAAQVVSRTDTHLPATHRYTSYMAVVEINTLFLMLKSHVPGKRVKAALDKI